MNDSISILRSDAKDQFDFAVNNEYTIEILNLIYLILNPWCKYDHLALLLFNKYAFMESLGVPVNDKVLEILNLVVDKIDDDVEKKKRNFRRGWFFVLLREGVKKNNKLNFPLSYDTF